MDKRKVLNEFESKIIESLKLKNATDGTIKLYLSNLIRLNGGEPLKNLNFLKKKDEIKSIVDKYKPNTQRSYIIAIVSILKNLPTYKKLYDYYYELMGEYNKNLKVQNKEEDVDPENNLTQDEVIKTQNELMDIVPLISKKKKITEKEYNKLFDLVLLSLYTLQPPRRNIDYQKMYIIKKYDDTLSTDKNYLDFCEGLFRFNNYKTQKTYTTQTEDINDELKKILLLYFKFHPLKKEFNEKTKNEIPFLVNYYGEPLKLNNDITRHLNKIFGKKIGVSKLRSIYLTSKYKNVMKDMQADTKAMGTSSQTAQNIYIKQ